MPSFPLLRRRVTQALLTSLACSALVGTDMLGAQTIGFEDQGYGPNCEWGGSPTILNQYQGYTWAGFRTLDLNNFQGPNPGCGRNSNTGYVTLSNTYVGNVIGLGSGAAGFFNNAANPFILKSLVAGAGGIDPTILTLQYYLGGVLQSTSTLNLLTNETGALTWTVSGGSRNVLYGGAADWIVFTPDYSLGADVFNSASESCIGQPVTCTPGPYASFFIDNLEIELLDVRTVPEPGTVALLGLGLAGVVGVMRRTRRS